MTREEAIKRIEFLKGVYSVDTETALDMAIEALQTIDNCDQCEWCCPSDGIPTIHVVRCKDCRHKVHCHETVAHTRIHDDFKEHWSEPIEWCSRGERKGDDSK